MSSNSKSVVDRSQWKPRKVISPDGNWIVKCSAFVDYCQNQLWSKTRKSTLEKSTLEWLKVERGLIEETIFVFGLGWNPQDAWRERKSWGLPDVIKDNGKPKQLWLPAGVVIPYYADGVLQRARIRRQAPEANPRYCIVSGSGMGPMILGDNRKISVIVESELDALLLHQEISDMAGVISLGNAQARPDSQTTELLRGADLILVALDSDDAGIKEALDWWPQNFHQAKWHPPIDGKDPGEMWKAGVNLKDWVEIGIERVKESTQEEPKQEDPTPKSDSLGPVAVSDSSSPDPGQADPSTLGDRLANLFSAKARIVADQLKADDFEWIEEIEPDLCQSISVAESKVDEVYKSVLAGGATVADFEQAVDRWYNLQLEAIQIYHDNLPPSPQSPPQPIQEPDQYEVRLHSDLLGEDFFLVSDAKLRGKVEAENPGVAVYLGEEIERMKGLKPEEVKKMHEVKKAFPGGGFVDDGKAEDSIFNRKE